MLSLDWEGSGKLSQRSSVGLALKEEVDVFRQRLEGWSEPLGYRSPFTEVSSSRNGFLGPS